MKFIRFRALYSPQWKATRFRLRRDGIWLKLWGTVWCLRRSVKPLVLAWLLVAPVVTNWTQACQPKMNPWCCFYWAEQGNPTHKDMWRDWWCGVSFRPVPADWIKSPTSGFSSYGD